MPKIAATTTASANRMKMKKNNLAILVAPDSTPLKPSKPAITAITKKAGRNTTWFILKYSIKA